MREMIWIWENVFTSKHLKWINNKEATKWGTYFLTHLREYKNVKELLYDN